MLAVGNAELVQVEGPSTGETDPEGTFAQQWVEKQSSVAMAVIKGMAEINGHGRAQRDGAIVVAMTTSHTNQRRWPE